MTGEMSKSEVTREATPDRPDDWQGFWHYVAGFFSGVSITILLLMLVL